MKKENNKFYTPEAEELHIGFELEISGESLPDWRRYVIEGIDDFKNIDINYEMRVKYLDKSDIESLGFEFQYYDEKDNYYEYSNKFIELKVDFDHHIVYIYRTELDEDPDFYTNYSLDFTIKNKSELKKLLKQIEIDEK